MNFAIPLAPSPGRPEFIGYVREHLEWVLEHDPVRLLELHGAELLPRWQRKRVISRRPSRLQSYGKVGGALLERMDLITKRVGNPRSDGNVTGPAQQGPKGRETEFGLIVDTGESITKVRRVINDFVRAGFLRGPRKGADGKMVRGASGRAYQRVDEYTHKPTGARRYCAHRVVYVFTDKFFERLGPAVFKRWKREQAAAVQRREERRQRMHPGPLLAGRERVRGMRHGSRETRGHAQPGAPTHAISGQAAMSPPPLSADAEANAARLVQALMHGLRNKHPEWGLERVRAEAERLGRSGRLH